MVDVVADQMIRDLHNFAVHPELFVCFTSNRIIGTGIFNSTPFVLYQRIIIFRIDDCEFALCQADSAEGVAVAEPAIQKHSSNRYAFNPNRYVVNDSNNPLLRRFSEKLSG